MAAVKTSVLTKAIPVYPIKQAEDIRDLVAQRWPEAKGNVCYLKIERGANTLKDLWSLNSELNRTPSTSNLERHRSGFRSYGWKNELGTISFNRKTGDLTNGQHRLRVLYELVESGEVECPEYILTTLTDAEFEPEQDRGKIRTSNDACSMDVRTQRLKGHHQTVLNHICKFGKALAKHDEVISNRRDGVKLLNTPVEYLSFLEKNEVSVDWFVDAYRQINKTVSDFYGASAFEDCPITRTHLISVVFALVLAGKSGDATRFLSALTEPSGVKYRNFLRKTLISLETDRRVDRNHPDVILSLAIKAFNVFIKPKSKSTFAWPTDSEGNPFVVFSEIDKLTLEGVTATMDGTIPVFA